MVSMHLILACLNLLHRVVILMCVGFLTSLQTHRRHAKILNADKEFAFKVVSCEKNLDSTKNFSSSCGKPIRTHSSKLIRTFGAASDGEVIVQPKDDDEATWQSILWRKWDAFVMFGRPYSVLGSVSDIFRSHYNNMYEQEFISNSLE